MLTNIIDNLVAKLKLENTETVKLSHQTGLSFIFHSISEEVTRLVKANLVPFFSELSKISTNGWQLFYTKDPVHLSDDSLEGFTVSEIPFGKRYEEQSQVFIRYDRWPITIIADKTKRVIVVSGQPEKDCATSIIRLIVQVLLFTIEVSQRFTLLHAASVFRNDRIVAFVSLSGKAGEQVIKSTGHGKTTAQVASAIYLGAEVHTGDMLIVTEQGIFAYPDIYKINQAKVFSQNRLRLLKQLPVYQGDVCLTPNDWKIIGVGCAGGVASKIINLLCFVDLKPKRKKYFASPISTNEALQRLQNSVRYDHLTDHWHNPNLLNLPRKSVKQLESDAEVLTKKLIQDSKAIFLYGGIQLEKVATYLKSLEV